MCPGHVYTLTNCPQQLYVGDSVRLETLVARQPLAVEQGVVRALRLEVLR